VTTHTLRRWEIEAEAGALPRPPGRPPHGEAERERARELVRQELGRQGYGAGEQPLQRALGLAMRLVRVALAEEKAAHRRRLEALHRAQRRTITVRARDAMWSIDATHLGRDPTGASVEAEVVRDVASGRTLAAAVGPPAKAAPVVALLERLRGERGGLPLVLAHDNGGAYRSELVASYLAARRVIELVSLPRTPQHNAWVEHGMRELKEGRPLGKGWVVDDLEVARGELQQARKAVDEHRPRRSRGWRTALQTDAALPPAEGLVARRRFYQEARCAIAGAVLHSATERQRRCAAREATLLCMQRFGLITRTRGGRPIPLANSYTVS